MTREIQSPEPNIINTVYDVQYNERGNYRIKIGDREGEWQVYTHSAFLTIGKETLIAFSEYWSDAPAPGLQCNVAYKLVSR